MIKHFVTSKLSENISVTPEGFLVCHNVLMARTGDMVYGHGETPLDPDDNGQVMISRDPEEVFHADTMASFEGKAVTIGHPEEFVGPDNWADLAKGIIQNVRRAEEKDEDGNESLVADLLITDATAIGLVKAGLREVSGGYEAEYEQTGKGKGRQTKIIGNHLALVEQGRAGVAYAINDQKGKGTMSKLAEKMKTLFAKAVDEAVAEEKKDKKDEAKDDGEASSADMAEVLEALKSLEKKVEGMAKPAEKPADPAPAPEAAAKDEGEEDPAPADKSLEERVKALEVGLKKLLEETNVDEVEEDDDGEGEESEDDGEGDDDMPAKTGDAKKKSEKTGLEGTKNSKSFDSAEPKNAPMTPEKMNEINAARWARK